MDQDFSDASLLLIGHGSTLNQDSAAPVRQHSAELRRRGVFSQVLEAFWKQEPSIRASLDQVATARLFIAPLFISEGYFTEQMIPRELGLLKDGETTFARIQRHGGRTLYYCAPVGTHDSMTGIILARAREVVDKHPFPRAPKPSDTALFVAGHGTERNENSRRAIECQVERIRARQTYAEAHAVFMEEAPRIGDCYQMAQAKNLVVVPFFISDGLHSYEDIPVMLGASEKIVRERLRNGQPTWRNPTERMGKRVWYARSAGTEPHLADVILERVQQAAQWSPDLPALAGQAPGRCPQSACSA